MFLFPLNFQHKEDLHILVKDLNIVGDAWTSP